MPTTNEDQYELIYLWEDETLHTAPVTTRQEIRDAAKQAARLQELQDTGGALTVLPATVGRDGVVRPVTLAQAAGEIVAAIRRADGALTVDVETTGYPVGHVDHALRTVQLGDEHVATVFDATDPAHINVVRVALIAATRLHAHSASADLVPLEALGATDSSTWDRMYDTVIPAKLADPQSTGSDPGLKKLSAAVLGDAAVTPGADEARAALFKAGRWLTDTKLTTPIERCGWAQVDSTCETMVRYAASDVLDTAALAVRLPQLPVHILARERGVQRVTARIAYRGLRIDGPHVEQLYDKHTAARLLAAEAVRGYGIEAPGSDKQTGERLLALGVELPQTDTGRPSVAADVLERLRGVPGEAGGLVAAVLDYRHHDTVLGTFLEPYRQLVTRGDGRARPTIYTLGTDTGRMSCVRPNLQQLPREGGVRACITADPGFLLVSADFSGVELRVAAALSEDSNLARIIAEGIDLHWLIARQVWGPDATKGHRYSAKRIVFGRLYGGGVATLAAQAGVSESLATSAIEVLDDFTPELAAWSRRLRNRAKAGALTMTTYAGRVIHLTREFPHKAPNYVIQGTARELLVDAIERWEQTPWAGGIVMPVHDEVLTTVLAEDAQAATTALVECMTTQLNGVTIVAEPSHPSYAWQDAV